MQLLKQWLVDPHADAFQQEQSGKYNPEHQLLHRYNNTYNSKNNICQFHQHFMCALFIQKSFWQLFSSHMQVEKSCTKHFHMIIPRVTHWWNWHLGSILPTYLRTAFTPVAPKRVRIQSSCQCLFTLLGSTGAKAVRKYVGEIDTW
jgi:hypothetical protein